MIATARMRSPREVLRKLRKKDDAAYDWANSQPLLFAEPDKGVFDLVKEIMLTHREIGNIEKETPVADPFVIALALFIRTASTVSECYVVTEERIAGLGSNAIKIPNVCKAYDIPCIRMVDVFELEDWSFG